MGGNVRLGIYVGAEQAFCEGFSGNRDNIPCFNPAVGTFTLDMIRGGGPHRPRFNARLISNVRPLPEAVLALPRDPATTCRDRITLGAKKAKCGPPMIARTPRAGPDQEIEPNCCCTGRQLLSWEFHNNVLVPLRRREASSPGPQTGHGISVDGAALGGNSGHCNPGSFSEVPTCRSNSGGTYRLATDGRKPIAIIASSGRTPATPTLEFVSQAFFHPAVRRSPEYARIAATWKRCPGLDHRLEPFFFSRQCPDVSFQQHPEIDPFHDSRVARRRRQPA